MTDRTGRGANPIGIVCEQVEYAVHCQRVASDWAITVAPDVSSRPIEAAADLLHRERLVGLALSRLPDESELAALARIGFARNARCVLMFYGPADELEDRLALASDLGLIATSDIESMLSALALIQAGARRPWSASTRVLPLTDRVQLGDVQGNDGRFVPLDNGLIGWNEGERTSPVGRAREIREALYAIRAGVGAQAPGRAVMEGVDERAVEEVLFGPPRALSDPASKTALQWYGLPLPVEELCSSPSRAAGEAARIGFPVRIALASPDLRVWDHPDLVMDSVDTASRVREVYRQLMNAASERDPAARRLGVTVTHAVTPIARVSIRAASLAPGWIVAELGFADPHGSASHDRTRTVLPASTDRIARILSRLRGSALLLDAGTEVPVVEGVSDVLLRLSAFVDRHASEVVSVEIRPLAVLPTGRVEVREACVTVSDHFVRSLATARGS